MTAQSDVGRLLAEILADPASTTARLVYADHLIELGDPRGELIQAQCLFEKIEWDDPQRRAIDERIADLLATHETEWTRDVRVLGFDDHLQQVTLRRGFVERVTIDAKDAARLVPQLRAVTPLRELHVIANSEAHVDEAGQAAAMLEALAFRTSTRALNRTVAHRLPAWRFGKLRTLHVVGPEAATAIANTPALATLEHLRVTEIDAAAMASVAAAPHLAKMQTLELPHAVLGSPGISALAGGKLVGLKRLQLQDGRFQGVDLAMLASAPFATQLQQLRVSNNALGTEGARVLANAFPKLELLDVESTELGAEAVRALLSSTNLEVLRSLDLSRNKLGETLAGAIDALALPALRHLSCIHDKLDESAAAALARSHRLAPLRSLDLSDNPLGDAGVIALAASTQLPNLEVLRIKRTGVTARGLAALGASALGARLRAIDLAHDEVDDDGLIALLGRAASLERLESLDLGASTLTLRGIQAFVASPLAARIKHFTATGLEARALDALLSADLPQLRSLVADRFDDEAARLLATSRGLPSLHSIVFSARELTDAGARALAESPQLQRVLWLQLDGAHVTDIGRAMLRERFGHHVTVVTGASRYLFGAR